MEWSDITIGSVFSLKKVITEADVLRFAELTGDFNPLHVDREFGRQSLFKNNIVHGMLAGSLFSTLIGMRCPGRNALYLSQTLNFKLPIYPGDEVEAKITVVGKTESVKVVVLKTEIVKDKKIVIAGEAKVKLI